jgi:mono/diheme cytochrome c family protein
MARQPRHNIASTSALFGDREAVRPPVAGTVVRASGDLAMLSSGRAGGVGRPLDTPAATDAAVARGRQRYLIDCVPCHGARGDGDGEVVRRGFPAPPPLAAATLRAAGDDRLEAAIRRGVGVMPPFADRISADDARAIVAYLRVLQRDPVAGAAR